MHSLLSSFIGGRFLFMESCECLDPRWPPDDLLVKYQYISDFFIAFAYFSIPMELIYFVYKSAFFPYRWVLMQFGLFIVLCGATHFINLWTFSMHSKGVAMVMAIAKMATAAVSCVTALMLVHIIPDLLSVKTRALRLKNKAEELDRERGLIIKQEETGRHVRMLTHEIRSTLDRHTILRTTLVELGRTLDLQECALWMPSRRGDNLEVTYTLCNLIAVGSTVPINLSVVNQIFHSGDAIRIPHTCPLARMNTLIGRRYVPPEVVAVRVPLLDLSNFHSNDWNDSPKKYAVMVLILPANGIRKWRDHELELVEVVADQVAVALSHADILEESMRDRDQLMEQNIALDVARQEAEMAIRARNDFLAVMNHEMTTPMHAIIALCSLLLETKLTSEERLMVETILKSSNLLETLVIDVLDLSKLEDGSLELDSRAFNLHRMFGEVIDLINPIASVKRLSVSLTTSVDLPIIAVGDERRLMQVILHIMGNAVKFTKEGCVSVDASIARPEYTPEDHHSHIYLRVQIKDSGCGITPQEMPHVFNKFSVSQSSSGAGLGLAICKRFVNLMGGHIWVESEGLGKGCIVTSIIKLGVINNQYEPAMHSVAPRDWKNQGSDDLLRYRQFIRDVSMFSSGQRYQRSL